MQPEYPEDPQRQADDASPTSTEGLTLAHREAIAVRHGERAAEARKVVRRAGASVLGGRLVPRVRRDGRSKVKRWIPEAEAAASSARWHSGRERGARLVFSNVAHCGEGRIELSCSDCGEVRQIPQACGNVRLCAPCWKSRAAKWLRKWQTAYAYLRDELAELDMFNAWRPGGAYTDKHLVLTFPHVLDPKGRQATAELRIQILFAAWKRFRKWIDGVLTVKGDDGHRRRHLGACYYRGFEWTPGADGMGHPHFHVWLMGPFLPFKDDHLAAAAPPPLLALFSGRKAAPCAGRDCVFCAAGLPRRTGLKRAWAEALRAEGVDVEHDGPLHVHLRKVNRAERFVREVRKDRHVVHRESKAWTLIDSSGEDVVKYFHETWSLAGLSEQQIEQAGPEVLAGVYIALHGRRLAQGSKVVLPSFARQGKPMPGLMGLAEAIKAFEGCPCCLVGAELGLEVPASSPRTVVVTPWFRVRDGPISCRPTDENPAKSTESFESDFSGLPMGADDHAQLVALLRRGGPGIVSATLSERFATVREDPSLLGGEYAWGRRRAPRRTGAVNGRYYKR